MKKEYRRVRLYLTDFNRMFEAEIENDISIAITPIDVLVDIDLLDEEQLMYGDIINCFELVNVDYLTDSSQPRTVSANMINTFFYRCHESASEAIKVCLKSYYLSDIPRNPQFFLENVNLAA